MAIIVKRKNRERDASGTVTFNVTGADVGKTYDFMGIIAGYRIVNVNVTVDEAFSNADNKVSVGLEDDLVRFVPQTAVNAVTGINYNNRQFEAIKPTAICINVVGAASANGKATVTVSYVKLPTARQDY